MKNPFSLVLILIFLGCTFPGQGIAQQFIYFRFFDGTQSAYPLQQVRKINFEPSFVKLQLSNGNSYSWATATIDYYKYIDIITENNVLYSDGNPWEVKVNPNPSEGKQLLRFRLPSASDLQVMVLDASGRFVLNRKHESLPKGEQELILDWPGVKPGNYQLIIQTKDFSATQKVIRR